MTYADDTVPLAWPGFQADGGLLLAIPPSFGCNAGPDVLDGDEMPLARKTELHVTVWNRDGVAASVCLGRRHDRPAVPG